MFISKERLNQEPPPSIIQPVVVAQLGSRRDEFNSFLDQIAQLATNSLQIEALQVIATAGVADKSNFPLFENTLKSILLSQSSGAQDKKMITPTLFESLFEIIAYVSVKLNEKICTGQKDLIQNQIHLF